MCESLASYHYLINLFSLLSDSESCIKGHRSSSCHHTDRALYEIKKTGRPVSQCEKCRELRKPKRMHSKCTCGSGFDSQASGSVTPALPTLASTSRRKSCLIAVSLTIDCLFILQRSDSNPLLHPFPMVSKTTLLLKITKAPFPLIREHEVRKCLFP